MPKGGPIYYPDVQSDIDMKGHSLLNFTTTVSNLTDANIATNAGIQWSKISKSGSLITDISTPTLNRDGIGLLKTYNVKTEYGAQGDGLVVTDFGTSNTSTTV